MIKYQRLKNRQISNENPRKIMLIQNREKTCHNMNCSEFPKNQELTVLKGEYRGWRNKELTESQLEEQVS